MIEEAESAALEQYLSDTTLATSRLALVEVPRATRIANPSPEVQHDTGRLLASCLLVDVSDRLLREAATLASERVRTLDAVHLATALYIEADEMVVYDRRLLSAAASHGLATSSPAPD